MAVEDLKSSPGTVKTGLQENAIGIPGILMQGIATIAPSFAILASFVFIVTYAGLVTPWAYLFGGVLLGLQALNAAQLAKIRRALAKIKSQVDTPKRADGQSVSECSAAAGPASGGYREGDSRWQLRILRPVREPSRPGCKRTRSGSPGY